MSNLSDVEWMFGDCATGALGFNALASYNPLRWSGSLAFLEAIKQMEENEKKEDQKNRPIIVKIPSGATTPEEKCNNAAEAIEYIKSKSPSHIKEKIAKMEADEKKKALLQEVESKTQELAKKKAILEDAEPKETAAKEALDAAIAKMTGELTPEVSWKYGDSGSSLGAFGKFFAHLNPNRWSGDRTMKLCSEEFEDLGKDEEEAKRPVQLKIKGEKTNYGSMREANEFLLAEVEKGDKTIEPHQRTYADAKGRVENARENVQKAEGDLADAQKNAKDGKAME